MTGPVNVFRNLFVAALVACAAFGSGLMVSPSSAETPAAVSEVGKKAPDFTLADVDGKSVRLSDFRKKFVVLEWFNDGCPFVKKHYSGNNMQSLQKEYARKGVVWLTICSSAPGKQGYHSNEEYKKILKEWNAQPSHLLLDPDGSVGHLYGAKTTPDMFVIAKDGTLVYAGAIDDKPDTDPESIKGSRNYVRDALDQSLAGKNVAVSSSKSYGCSVKYQ